MTLPTVLEGVALTLLGDAETGLSMTDKGIELYQGMTAPPTLRPLIRYPRSGSLLFRSSHRGLALSGDVSRRNIPAVDRVEATKFTIA